MLSQYLIINAKEPLSLPAIWAVGPPAGIAAAFGGVKKSPPTN